ncbi:MAG: class II glutamine amidotransferase [Candidatus Azobacteroides sp.]|nr:class II glutamine amidotransferase [Candidatus Azobacteroides sp.]
MCVIIVKPSGIKLPNEKILNQAALHNPHGFGFCTAERIYKTLFFDLFMKEIRKADKNEPCIIHFRYATTGSVKRANCHPFKNGNISFAHNGVLNVETKNDMTDSETFFKDIAMKAINKYGYNSRTFDDIMIKNMGFSKFALMSGRKIKLFGNFTEYSDGCYYSNLNFLNRYY